MTLSNAITALRPLCPVVDDASKKEPKGYTSPSFFRAYSFVAPCALYCCSTWLRYISISYNYDNKK